MEIRLHEEEFNLLNLLILTLASNEAMESYRISAATKKVSGGLVGCIDADGVCIRGIYLQLFEYKSDSSFIAIYWIVAASWPSVTTEILGNQRRRLSGRRN